MLQAFTDRTTTYGKIISIAHAQGGYERLGDLLEELKQRTKLKSAVVLEAVGSDRYYHHGLNDYL